MRLPLFIMTALGVGLCVTPLAALLGYESAAVTGAVAGLVVLVSTLRRLPPALLSGAQSPARAFLALLPSHLALLLPPALLLILNAIRVPNCDLLLGVKFWLVIPVVSVIIGQTLGAAVSVLPRWRLPAALAVLGGEVGALLWRLAWYPPITGHEWLIGYFSGSLYDEALSLPAALLWHRLLLLLVCTAVVLVLEASWRAQAGRSWRGLAAVLAAVLVSAGGISSHHAQLGIALSRAVVIYYDPGSFSEERLALLGAEHELRYAHHVDFFGFDPVAERGEKLGSFVYPDRVVQKRLMGSRSTLVARPWTGEMHIRWPGYGQSALGHELAHLFSAEFGAGPLRLPARGGLGVDIGLLEGIAEAADWPADELPPHQAAAALRQLDLAPDLRGLFTATGFWSEPSGRAYHLVGSFVRYLIETYGIEPFKQAYTHSDFQAAYGRGVVDLITEWEGFIDALSVSDAEREMAAYRYRRSSIFEKVCARTIAELRRQARAAAGRQDLQEARALWEQIVAFEPGSTEHRLSLAEALAAEGHPGRALAEVEELLSWELSMAWRARVLELQGDLLWADDRPEEAAAAYAESLGAGLPDGTRRRLEVKRLGALSAPAAAALARRYLLDSIGRAQKLYTTIRWAEVAPEDPLPRYLTGLQLYAIEDWPEATRWLSSAPLPTASLDGQRTLLLARARMLSGAHAAARFTFAGLRMDPSRRIRMAAEKGLEETAFWARRQGAESVLSP